MPACPIKKEELWLLYRGKIVYSVNASFEASSQKQSFVAGLLKGIFGGSESGNTAIVRVVAPTPALKAITDEHDVSLPAFCCCCSLGQLPTQVTVSSNVIDLRSLHDVEVSVKLGVRTSGLTRTG